jgi:hypothetical protein
LIVFPNFVWQVRHHFISFHFLQHIHTRDVAEGLTSLHLLWRRTVATAYLIALTGWGLYICMVILPLASRGPLRDYALENNGDLREEIGWTELVKTLASIQAGLPPDRRNSVGVLVENYGEAGAIEILGAPYHLPRPISGTNSAWLRGYPVPPPSTLIVVGLSREYVDKTFESCQLVGHNGNSSGVHNEESEDHPDIFLCNGPQMPWPMFWKEFQNFG